MQFFFVALEIIIAEGLEKMYEKLRTNICVVYVEKTVFLSLILFY